MKKLDNIKDFDNIISKRCVVDFYADWCGPCKMLEPVIEEVSSEHSDIDFISVNVDDFRDLAKDLAAKYRTRIELHQVGARDKAKTVGGLGVCGHELCCKRFLKKIDPITMNMAKDQNIALNPSKINGSCGRLLCCLAYEEEVYQEYGKGMPEIGKMVKTEYGVGPVISLDILSRKYKVSIDNEIKEIEMK